MDISGENDQKKKVRTQATERYKTHGPNFVIQTFL